MRSRSPFFSLRVLAVTATASLALGLAACGGSGDDSDSGSDREQARETVEDLYAAIRAGDAAGVCEQLNEAAQKQMAQGGLGTKTGSCTESFQRFLDKADEQGGLNLTLKAKVESVKVTGDTAVAKVSFGSRDGEIPLEKVDGEWKLEAAGASPSN